MEGIKRAINKYKEDILEVPIEILERVFGKASFDVEALTEAAGFLSYTRVHGQGIQLKQMIQKATEYYPRFDNGGVTPDQAEYLKMLILTLSSDPRIFQTYWYSISLELDCSLPIELRSKKVQAEIDKYGDKLYAMTLHELATETNFNNNVLYQVKSESFGEIIRFVAENYHQLSQFNLTEQEIDYVQMITRVLYSDPRTFVDHQISPKLRELLV